MIKIAKFVFVLVWTVLFYWVGLLTAELWKVTPFIGKQQGSTEKLLHLLTDRLWPVLQVTTRLTTYTNNLFSATLGLFTTKKQTLSEKMLDAAKQKTVGDTDCPDWLISGVQCFNRTLILLTFKHMTVAMDGVQTKYIIESPLSSSLSTPEWV